MQLNFSRLAQVRKSFIRARRVRSRRLKLRGRNNKDQRRNKRSNKEPRINKKADRRWTGIDSHFVSVKAQFASFDFTNALISGVASSEPRRALWNEPILPRMRGNIRGGHTR
jgi:hypothetical protein